MSISKFSITVFFVLASIFIISCRGAGEIRRDYEYQEVTKVDASAEQIYDQSLTWMAQAFEKSDDAIQLRDEENRRIVANAIVGVSFTDIAVTNVEMDLIVEAKDGRFRMTGRNYQLLSSSEYVEDRPLREGHLEEVQKRMDSLRNDLKSYVKSSKSDDW